MSAPRASTLFPYTTLFRSRARADVVAVHTPDRDDGRGDHREVRQAAGDRRGEHPRVPGRVCIRRDDRGRSEEHTSELQSLTNLVCRLLLEKKKQEEAKQTS